VDPSESWKIGLFVLFILLNAIFSAAETALISLRRSRLQALVESGSRSALLAEKVLNQPDRYLASIQFASTTLTAMGAALLMLLFQQWFVRGPSMLLLFSAGVTALLLFLLLGELVPKSMARQNSESATLLLVRPVVWMTSLLFPVIQLLIFLSKVITRLMPGQHVLNKNPYVTEEEIKVLVEKGEEMGDLEEDEREMVTAIFDLDRMVVREVMVPRVDMSSIDVNQSLNDILDTISRSGHTRLPVYDGSSDNIVGVLHAKDLLRFLRHGKQGFGVRRIMRPAHYVPENKNAKTLLEEMRARHMPFAVVVDEYGGTAGVVTIEDLIEEIVGEIRDEYDVEEDEIIRLGQDVALVDARASIDDVNDELDVRLPTEEYDSVGGFVVGLFGEVPEVGNETSYENVRFIVEEVGGNRVRRARIIVNREGDADSRT
jgi:putative hemolysin